MYIRRSLGSVDLLQVTRLIRRKSRLLDTDTEGARASKSKSKWRLGTRVARSGQIDSARDFILPFCKRSIQITLLAQRNERL